MSEGLHLNFRGREGPPSGGNSEVLVDVSADSHYIAYFQNTLSAELATNWQTE